LAVFFAVFLIGFFAAITFSCPWVRGV